MTRNENLYCQGCGAILPVRAIAGRIKCEFCGAVHLSNTEPKWDKGDLDCPHCGFVNPPAAQYCGDCGKPFYHTCSRCGTQNRMKIIYCSKCGADIEKASIEDRLKDINIEKNYLDYLQEGNRLWREYSILSGIPGAISVLSGCGAGIYFLVTNILNPDNIGIGLLLYFGFSLLGIIPAAIIVSISMKRVKNIAGLIAKNKPGFDKFFDSLFEGRRWQRVSSGSEHSNPGTKDYWPQTAPDEIKRKEFLSIIGQK